MSKARSVAVAIIGVVGSVGTVYGTAKCIALWTTAGQNTDNTRYQADERRIGVHNARRLHPRWKFQTHGDVSATPAVDERVVYFPDWAGYLYAVDRHTGKALWTTEISSYTGVPAKGASGEAGGVVRATPAIVGNLLIMGDQGGRLGFGAKLFAVDRRNGKLVWMKQIQGNGADPADTSAGAQFAFVTQPVIVDARNPDVGYVGTASYEETITAFIPGYPCCSFRGTVIAFSTKTGKVLWRTYTVPPVAGYSGNGVWGSTGSLDAQRKTLYITTGNNYSVPANVATCIAAAAPGDDQRACLSDENYVDAILAIDTRTGGIKWSTLAVPFDTWNVNCIFPVAGNPCPTPTGPDYDFAQGPMLFTAKVKGKKRDLVGAGQKSGDYWALDRATGAVVWKTNLGPGGTFGGLQWGSASDGERIFVANNNSLGTAWTPKGSAQKTTSGAWSAIDATNGAVLWQVPAPEGAPGFGSSPGPLSLANGVVYGCSFAGTYTALNAKNGAQLWKADSGRSTCAAGASIAEGTVFWGTGYNAIMGAAVQPSTVTAFVAD